MSAEKPPPLPACAACLARWQALAPAASSSSGSAASPSGATAAAASSATAAASSSGATAAAGASPQSAASPQTLRHAPFILDPARGIFSACDVRRLAAEAALSSQPAEASVWLTANGAVYRIPLEWIDKVHPGGPRSIKGRAGADCSVDWEFHSTRAHTVWRKFAEGRLAPCTGAPSLCSIS